MTSIEKLFVGFWNWAMCNIDDANAQARREVGARRSAPQAGPLNGGRLSSGKPTIKTVQPQGRRICTR
jgi:hypothetical protein